MSFCKTTIPMTLSWNWHTILTMHLIFWELIMVFRPYLQHPFWMIWLHLVMHLVDKPRLPLDVEGNEAKLLFFFRISNSNLLAEHHSKSNKSKFVRGYSVCLLPVLVAQSVHVFPHLFCFCYQPTQLTEKAAWMHSSKLQM